MMSVTGLENDKIYSIEINLSELPEYLDEVVTVADLAKVLQKQLVQEMDQVVQLQLGITMYKLLWVMLLVMIIK